MSWILSGRKKRGERHELLGHDEDVDVKKILIPSISHSLAVQAGESDLFLPPKDNSFGTVSSARVLPFICSYRSTCVLPQKIF